MTHDDRESMMGNLDMATDAIAIAEIDLSPEEEAAISALNARIRIMDSTWGDSVNDETAILRVVLASRMTK